MNIISRSRYRLERSSQYKQFIGYCLVVSMLILVVIITACGLIPGGKECDAVVKSFMEAAVAKDVDTACSLYLSPLEEAKRKNIEQLILEYYVLLEGYQDVKMQNIEVQTGKLESTAVYGGEVTYAGGFKGWVYAELVKQGEEWNLTFVQISISPEKMADYEKRHEQ